MQLNDVEFNRSRIGWWVFVVLLIIAAAFLVYSFIGMVALNVFGYYATRPICRRLGPATSIRTASRRARPLCWSSFQYSCWWDTPTGRGNRGRSGVGA
jgi:hypothetical protein